jgi:hypothetical protein
MIEIMRIIFGSMPRFSRQIGLGDLAHHRLRRARRRQQRQHLRVMLLGEVDPRRAARGEGRALLRLEVAEQFGAFLHDHHVGAEVGVEDHVGAEFAQRGDDLPLDVGAGRQAELLAEADADRRRRLEHGDDVRVGEVIEHFLRLVALGQGAGRADHDTLTAGDARRSVDRSAFEPDAGGVAPARELERVDVLDLAADGDAALRSGCSGCGRR